MISVLVKTYPLIRTWRGRVTVGKKNQSGMTLIEMMVVAGLIAIISYLSLPSVSNYFRLSLESVSRRMASIVKDTYNSALVTGRVHRIVYDFKERKFWVEVGPTSLLLERIDPKNRRSRTPEQEDAAKAEKNQFELEKSITRDKVDLPRGVSYFSIQTEQGPDPIIEGMAYTHFFPHGLTEKTIVRLKDTNNNKISLKIEALTGHTRLYYSHELPEGDT